MQGGWRAMALGLLGMAVGPWSAAGARVSVEEVEFREIEHEPSGEDWLEATVEIDLELAAGEQRYLEDLEVALTLALENEPGAEPAFRFFGAAAEPVALEEGRGKIRFYLPPEVRDLYDLVDEPHSYLAEVRWNEEIVALYPSRRLQGEDALEGFRRLRDEQAARGEGVLRPQDLSPFRELYPDSTPTYRIRLPRR